jgi:CDGSH-type Zn-finger protein
MEVEQPQEQQNKPKILPLPNGPYYPLNDMTPKAVPNLQTSDGKPLSNISGTALCRCGASKNKPFCDGTHGTIGFLSDNKVIQENGQISKDKKKSYTGKNIIIHDNRQSVPIQVNV